MVNIWHTRFPLYFWLHSVAYLERFRERIAFIARQENLDEDFPRLLDGIGTDAGVQLPHDDVRGLRTRTGFERALSPHGERNILEWYKDDIEFLCWCDELRRSAAAPG